MERRTVRLLTAAATASALILGGVGAASQILAAVPGEQTVRFAAAADFSANADTRAVLDTLAATGPDLAVALGDLSYAATGAEQAWCDLVTQSVGAGFPFELVAGNHESNGVNGNINDFSACLPNQLPGLIGTYGRQWYVDVPAQAPLVRFVMISPALTFPDGSYQFTAGSPRYAWTAAAIDGARAASIPWVVVGMHKPCLSLGEYGGDPGTDLIDMLVGKKVDLVLTGHEHLYQRTAQLALGAGCPGLTPGTFTAACVADGDSSLVRGAGTVFATVGTGGQTQRPIHPDDPEAPYFVATSGSATATWGLLDVQATVSTLTAAFVRASGGTFTDAFTIGAPGANTPPTASFTASCTDLDCTVDGSASGDPDGTISGYAWAFGDGSTGSGPTASHVFATAGTYPIVLTVTDDDGATATSTRSVTVTAPATGALAADAFERSVTNGLGTADVGGAWQTTGSVSRFSVAGGTGNLNLARAGRLDAALPAVTSTSTDLVVGMSMDKNPTGGGLYASLAMRRLTGVGEYRTNLRLNAGGAVVLGLARTAGSTEVKIGGTLVVPGLTYRAGDRLMVRMQASGTSPTVLRARVWAAGSSEPSTWQVGLSDSTAGLQAAGSIGLNLYLSSSATDALVTVALDDLVATTP